MSLASQFAEGYILRLEVQMRWYQFHEVVDLEYPNKTGKYIGMPGFLGRQHCNSIQFKVSFADCRSSQSPILYRADVLGETTSNCPISQLISTNQ